MATAKTEDIDPLFTGFMGMTSFASGAVYVRYEAISHYISLDALWKVILNSIYTDWDLLARRGSIVKKQSLAIERDDGAPQIIYGPSPSGGDDTLEELCHSGPTDEHWRTERICQLRYTVQENASGGFYHGPNSTSHSTSNSTSNADADAYRSSSDTYDSDSDTDTDGEVRFLAKTIHTLKTVHGKTVYELEEFFTGPDAHREVVACCRRHIADVIDWRTVVRTAVNDEGNAIMRRAAFVQQHQYQQQQANAGSELRVKQYTGTGAWTEAGTKREA